MRASLAATAIFFFVSSAAHSQSITLWQNLTVGMSKAEVKALYPDGKVSLTPDCEANVKGNYAGGRLISAFLKFGDWVGAGRSKWDQGLNCQAIVRASLFSRYGEPSTTTRRLDYKGVDTGEKLTWLIAPLSIEFYAADRAPLTVVQYIFSAPESGSSVPPLAKDKL